MSDDDEKKNESGFKVTDRRLFTPEGEPRSDIEKEPPPGPEVQESRQRPQAPPPPREPKPSSRPPEEPHPFTAAPEEKRTPQAPMEPPDFEGAGPASAEMNFANFLLSLATTAMVGLGEMPDPNTGIVSQNLESARQMIDILGILKQKTQGNLDAEESRLLEGLLYELRMKYVALRRGSASGTPPAGAS